MKFVKSALGVGVGASVICILRYERSGIHDGRGCGYRGRMVRKKRVPFLILRHRTNSNMDELLEEIKGL